MPDIDVVGEIAEIEVVVVGPRIRHVSRLKMAYGEGRWRKLKGYARVGLSDGSVHQAEVHWYETHGIGRKELKIKRLLS